MLLRQSVGRRESQAMKDWLSSPASSSGNLADYLYDYGRFGKIPNPAEMGDMISSRLLRWHESGGSASSWKLSPRITPESPWLAFEREVATPQTDLFKAYLSFPPLVLISNLAAIMALLTNSSCQSFKAAIQGAHVTRADSFVIYTGDAEGLNELVGSLGKILPANDPSELLLAAATDHPNIFWAIDRPALSWRRMASLHVATAFEAQDGDVEERLCFVAETLHLLGLCSSRWLPYSFLRSLNR